MIKASAIDAAIDRVLLNEGGFVDNPADPGGPTNRGITLATLVSVRFPNRVSVEDLRALTEDQARAIYVQRYVTGPKFHELSDERLFTLVVDCGVNHGTETATRWLQRAAGVPADGIMGPQTLDALRPAGAPSVAYKRVLRQRLEKYAGIVHDDTRKSEFLVGWVRRAADFLDPLELPGG